MKYDVQIGNTIHRGISYAELIMLQIEPDTFVRRRSGDWIQAKDCIELTHILAQRVSTGTRDFPPSSSYDINENSLNNFDDEGIDYYEDYEDNEDNENEQIIADFQYPTTFQSQTTVTPDPPNQSYYQQNNIEDERIFIPTAAYFKCKQKRKAAIIGVCTLGLAGLSLMGIGNTWRSNIFEGTSLSANAGIGFVLKCLSFLFLTALIAIPYFIYSVFSLIYYTIRLHNLKR